MVYQKSNFRKQVVALACVCALAILLTPKTATGQVIQPTGNVGSQTGNPQSIPIQNLGPSTTMLQGSAPQVLGTSINQLGGGTLRVAQIKTANSPDRTTQDYTTSALDNPQQQVQNPQSIISNTLIAVVGIFTLLCGLLALYLAGKKKTIEF